MEWGLGMWESSSQNQQGHPTPPHPILLSSLEKPPLATCVSLSKAQLSLGSSSTSPVHARRFPAALASSLQNNPVGHMAEPGGVGLAGLSHA